MEESKIIDMIKYYHSVDDLFKIDSVKLEIAFIFINEYRGIQHKLDEKGLEIINKLEEDPIYKQHFVFILCSYIYELTDGPIYSIFNCNTIYQNEKLWFRQNVNWCIDLFNRIDSMVVSNSKINYFISFDHFCNYYDVNNNINNKLYIKSLYDKIHKSKIYWYFDDDIKHNVELFKHYIRRYKENQLLEQLQDPKYVYSQNTELADWIIEEIEEMKKCVNDPFMDNIRFARCASTSQMKRYYEQKSRGCCGFYDGIVVHPKFGKYKIGCNYGH